ncbi:MAG: RluA family pseudouridine synthase [Bacteroidia bacterium]|nr:RluA family pseudouridine synthase [Bacteroidia bacterium]
MTYPVNKSLRTVRMEDILIYEDDDIVLVSKPLDMASLDDKNNRNLKQLAQTYYPDLRLCHRLDKNTSGILLMAKGADNYRTIAMQFEQREIRKVYHTLVAGIHSFDGFEIALPLLISTNKKVTVSNRLGKPSLTRIYTEETFRHYTLLRCEPVTGRMHQIRVHLSAVGCPIVGDELYGGTDIMLSQLKRKYKPSGRKEELPVNHGYLLHARSLHFTHPRTGEPMSAEAPYPDNFETTLKVLRKYDL